MKECKKIPFETEEEARKELERIVNTNHSPWKDKKPTRKYQCEICGKYHLTSKLKLNEIHN